eukprot:365124-Chlamydomonas_euryale.AAC.13
MCTYAGSRQCGEQRPPVVVLGCKSGVERSNEFVATRDEAAHVFPRAEDVRERVWERRRRLRDSRTMTRSACVDQQTST